MNKRNYEDFINKYNDELIPRIKETLLSIKPDYKYVIRVEKKQKSFGSLVQIILSKECKH